MTDIPLSCSLKCLVYTVIFFPTVVEIHIRANIRLTIHWLILNLVLCDQIGTQNETHLLVNILHTEADFSINYYVRKNSFWGIQFCESIQGHMVLFDSETIKKYNGLFMISLLYCLYLFIHSYLEAGFLA